MGKFNLVNKHKKKILNLKIKKKNKEVEFA